MGDDRTAGRKQRRRAYTEAAERLGVSLGGRVAGASLKGEVGGLTVRVTLTAGEDVPTHTQYRVRYPSLGLGLKVRKRYPGSDLAARTWARHRAVTTGDPEFDETYDTRAKQPDRAAVLLDRARREAVSAALGLAAYPRLSTIGDDTLYVACGPDPDAEEIVTTLHTLVGAATALAGR
ncbi:MAG: hypothetical protein KQH83_12680 [Actinobacteria bacterium]|nr:hypothetical protein [Actinomycetota bacterium]